MSKKPKTFVAQAVTGNDAANGLVVFRTADGRWSHALSDAQVAETEDAAAALLARAVQDATDNIVVEPYLIDVAREAAGLRALKFREAIRAEGPTVGYALTQPAPADAA
jgi:hypothetical protein